jgi:hypothetical protein
MKLLSAVLILALAIPLQSGGGFKRDENQSFPESTEDERRAKRGKITGDEGLSLFGGNSRSDADSYGGGIAVNSFLWRASLDALSFAPLANVDPHGGVIITDWYEDPASKGEKFKLNVLILGKKLRADGVRVSVFKRTKSAAGEWEDAAVSKTVNRELEDKILTRARELRIKNAK